MDRNSPDYYVEKTEDSVPDTELLIADIRNLSPSKGASHGAISEHSEPYSRAHADGSPYVYPILTPRFAISTTEELLGKLRVLADSDHSLAIQTHISENREEVKETKKLFAHLGTPEHPITYAGVYDHYHLLRENTVLAHAVYLEPEELDLIKKRNSGISHCPTSNFNLTSGMAHVGVMLDREIKVDYPCLLNLIPVNFTFTGRPRH